MSTKFHFHESGQVLVILTIGIVVLLAFAGLAIDQGSIQVDRRRAQNAADTAALAGALARYEGQDCEDVAADRAESNGFITGDDVTVAVDCYYDFGEGDDYVRVTIETTTATFFSSLIGWDSVTNQVEAVVYIDEGAAEISEAFTGGAIMALKPTGNDTFLMSGNAKLNVQGGGAFVNSNGASAFSGDGNQTYTTQTGMTIVGGALIKGNVTVNSDITAGGTVQTNGNVKLNGVVKQNQVVKAIAYPPPELEIAAPVVVEPSCSASGTMSTEGGVVRLTPGSHPERDISGNKTVIFAPGNYCFSGDLLLSGNLTITADNTQFNMSGGNDISLNGNMTFHAANSLLYLHSGSFIMDGNAKLQIPNSIVYIQSGNFIISKNQTSEILSDQTSIIYLGAGSIHFNGNNVLVSTNTLFYLKAGSLTWNGNADLIMDAPDEGDYAGLLIYMPTSNTSTLRINGNADTDLAGSIIAPGGSVVINGNSSSAVFNSRIIGYTITLSGNTTTNITFSEDENYDLGEGGTPILELTK